MSAQEAIEHFLHGQIECWNNGDKEGFFEHYRRMSPAGLSIEYVGRALPTDPWQILEGMWENQQPRFRVEVKETIINGEEAACHHRNALRDGSGGIETIERTVSRTAGCGCVTSSRREGAMRGAMTLALRLHGG